MLEDFKAGGQTINRFVTVSVDDGHPSDKKTAELFLKYGVKGTFYIPTRNAERETMPEDQIRNLARHFEIGGHTINHVPLRSLPRKQAWQEIADCKKWLEDVTGNNVGSFCYPKGKVDRETAELVKRAGFVGARTCFFNLHDFPADPFFWGVSTHAYSHGRVIQMRHALLEGNLSGAWNYWSTYKGAISWREHFLCALDHVEQHGGIAHLYMHSWEIDQLQQWEILESVLQAIGKKITLTRVTNGELFELWSQQGIASSERVLG